MAPDPERGVSPGPAGPDACLLTDALEQVMTRGPVIVDRGATLDEAQRLFDNYGFRHLLVVELDRIVGILSDRDLRLATALQSTRIRLRDRHGQAIPGARLVEEIQRSPVHCLPPQASPGRAARDMVQHQIGAIPVVQGETLVGIVTETDLLRVFVERCRCHQTRDDLARFHLREPIPQVGPDTSLEDALEALDRRIDHLGVLRAGKLVGIVSERDLAMGLARASIRDARAESEGRLENVAITVAELMEPRVVTAEPGFPLSRCAARMLDHHISSLPMVEEGQVVGILTQRHVLEHFARNA
jgi:CBS domain-containing protein